MLRRFPLILLTLVLGIALSSGGATARTARSIGGLRVRHAPQYDLRRYVPAQVNIARYSGMTANSGVAVKTPSVGTTRKWIAIDDFKGTPYLQKFKLRGKGKHVEVWVATGKGLDFKSGDCRNDSRTNVTDGQVKNLIKQFDGTIYPKETSTFAKPADRDGTGSTAHKLFDVSKGEYKGDADNTVALVYNIKDDVYYDTNNSQDLPYVAGFFSRQLTEIMDRNIMTIDSYDWKHRTGGNPPDDPTPNPCTNAPGKPFLVESTFAHEWQHLIEYYSDPNEYLWTDEGMSEWAISLTGYGDPSQPITSLGYDPAVQCFYGNLGATPDEAEGGPENSLTEWEDQPDPIEILCDYGAARTFVEYLADRFGDQLIGRLHRAKGNGLTGLQAVLNSGVSTSTSQDLVHDWAAMVALDSVLDDGATLTGRAANELQSQSLDALINWSTPDAFSSPGAPSNGSDYVRARDGSGAFLGAGQIESISFQGQATASRPIEWTIDPSPPEHTTDAAIYSGEAIGVDRQAILEVTVPTANPTLNFDTRYETESGYDFGFVRVSEDGGRTYKSLSNSHTTSNTGDGAISEVTSKLPGLTGDSNGWRSESFNLAPYAGKTVFIDFRYISDGVTAGPGWWLDDVAVGGTTLSDGSDLSVWKSPTDVRPFQVGGYTVLVVAYDDAHSQAWVTKLALTNRAGSISGAALDAAIGTTAQTVGIIVMQDDPKEIVPAYARYDLKVNGVTQPGGS